MSKVILDYSSYFQGHCAMWRRSLEDWLATTSLSGFNQFYIEQLYEQFTDNPQSVDPKWAELFRDLESGSLIQDSRYYNSLAAKETDAAAMLIATYRNYGHLLAKIDPLERWNRKGNIPFNLIDYQLHPDQEVKLFEDCAGQKVYFARDLLQKLQEIYTSSLGYEFVHISNPEEREWLITEIEKGQQPLLPQDHLQNLSRLVQAESLEQVLANKFPGAKRFALEGNESFIPLLDKLFEMAADNNYRDLYLSMAHRGRLSTLVNSFLLPTPELFNYFAGEGPLDDTLFCDDVKYHLGRSARFQKTSTLYKADNSVVNNPYWENLDVHLCYNPSHLEFANAICLGASRARQTELVAELNQNSSEKLPLSAGTNLVLPILVHGDSAISGQGIVQEILNLSNTRGYSVGGAIHVVINNQIGFTTSNLKDMRSSTYCTDIAKMIEAPIIHVNGEDVEAVVQAASLAFKYRQKFKKDIFIDLLGYRRLGHNEGDDPTVTQPKMYRIIKNKAPISELYNQHLETQGLIAKGTLKTLRKEIYQALLQGSYTIEFSQLKGLTSLEHQANFMKVEMTANGRPYQKPGTKVNFWDLERYHQELATIPEGIAVSPTVAKLYQRRADPSNALYWGEAELLAYATLLGKGIDVRLTGEDSGRGTFFHRVGVLHDAQRYQEVIPLLGLAQAQSRNFEIWDSTLSENAVLGFEYGYSITSPKTLTLWEAQFGDFANGAQVIIDQFISSGESKWNQVSGLTLLLPHGYEGQGPEHSSARIERFLQLCANNNMRVVVPTSARQIFHLLVEQGLAEVKKPLIIFTPKSLLRNAQAATSLEELASSEFRALDYVEGDFLSKAPQIEKLILTNGRIRYDVQKTLAENGYFDDKVFAIAVEELYPWPQAALKQIFRALPNLKVVEWVQDEPSNQGSWSYAFPLLLAELSSKGIKLNLNSREACATTAAGYGKRHNRELAQILAKLNSRDFLF